MQLYNCGTHSSLTRMDLAFIVDPLDHLKAYKDSSVAMMREAVRRGHRVHAILQGDLIWRDGRVSALATALTVHANNHQWYETGERAERGLEDFSAVIMRKDPPFD